MENNNNNGEGKCPFMAEVDPPRPEDLGVLGGPGGPFEHVLSPGHLEFLEPRGHDRGLKLCLQQSSRDSVRPEVDVAFRSFRHWL